MAMSKNDKQFFKVLAAAIGGMILIGGFAIGSTTPATPSGSEAQAAPAQVQQEPEAIQVSAQQLASAYTGNEVSADRAYKGKLLAVSGVVSSIGKAAFTETPVISLNGEPFNVYAEFDDPDTAARMYPGEFITLVCKSEGKTLVSPYLDDCRLPPAPKPAAIKEEVAAPAPAPAPAPDPAPQPAPPQAAAPDTAPQPEPDTQADTLAQAGKDAAAQVRHCGANFVATGDTVTHEVFTQPQIDDVAGRMLQWCSPAVTAYEAAMRDQGFSGDATHAQLVAQSKWVVADAWKHRDNLKAWLESEQ